MSLGCRDSCGKIVVDEEAALQAGWHYLMITKQWRCGECARSLGLAQHLPGTPGAYRPDPLPPTSRGALSKETASGILPPSVKP